MIEINALKENFDLEGEMQEAFWQQVDEVVKTPERFEKKKDVLRVGLESEMAIYNPIMAVSDLAKVRDDIISEFLDFSDIELGAGQIETRTEPYDIINGGWKSLCDNYALTYEKILTACRRNNMALLRIGSNPFLPVKNSPRTTSKEKYQIVPDFYNEKRLPEKDTIIGLGRNKIDIGDAAVVSLFQSFQVNLEAKSFSDACDKMNRSLFIAPYLLAFSGNARYLEAIDTRMSDLRTISWEKSHDNTSGCADSKMDDLRTISWEKSFDLRTKDEIAAGDLPRIGLPKQYFFKIEDYFSYVGSFPFILYQPYKALLQAIGLSWFDTRIKIIGDSAVVELRVLSTQPTIEEELVLTLLYLGRLNYSQAVNEPLMPLDCVKENRLTAMLYGRKEPMWFYDRMNKLIKIDCDSGLRLELSKAIQGLEILEMKEKLNMDLLQFMYENGTPSSRLAAYLPAQKEIFSKELMAEAMKENKMLIS